MPKTSFFKLIWRELRSLRTLIIVAIVIASVLPVILIRLVVLETYQNRTMDTRITYVEGECNILASDILQYNYFSNQKSEVIRAELEEIAYMYNARILILNDSLKVVEDTYLFQKGKTLLSEYSIKALRGEMGAVYDRKSGYAKVYTPIVDKDNGVVGVILVTLPDTNVISMRDYLARLINVLIIAFALISLLGAIAISHILIRPLRRMKNAIAVIADGSQAEELEPRTLMEYNDLAQAVNGMLSRLRMLDQSRQEFVSNVSHELKTPMTSMKVLAESLVGQENVPIEMYQEFMTDIVSEIDRENQIISDLLTMVKLDQAHGVMNISTVNVNELTELVLKRLRPIAQTRNIELLLESFRPVAAEADEVKLTLAITNLVENAIKYNVEGGWVHVSVNADHKFFYIKVSDSGIGIPSDKKEQVFERFYRVDKARSRETGGTGLGLAITKNVILMHKGTIKLYSKENQGTTFTVRVPLNYVEGGQQL